jgi:hypothetical protein
MAVFGCTIKVCRYHDWCRDPTAVPPAPGSAIIEAGVFENAHFAAQISLLAFWRAGLRRAIYESALVTLLSRPGISRPSYRSDFLRAISTTYRQVVQTGHVFRACDQRLEFGQAQTADPVRHDIHYKTHEPRIIPQPHNRDARSPRFSNHVGKLALRSE